MPIYIHHGHALPLEAQGYIVFDIGNVGDGLFLRLIEHVSVESNDPGSVGQGNHIYLDSLLRDITNAVEREGYFEGGDLQPAIDETARGGQETDLNVPGFVTAVLFDIGFVEALPRDGGGYHRSRFRFRQAERKSPPFTGTASPRRQRR